LTLGEFIRKKRIELGYEKIDFSKALNITYGSLRKWETDRFIPSGINKRNLIKILNLSHDEIKLYFNY